MTTFNFSPIVLEWAANNAGLTWKSLADKIITRKSKREEALNDAYNGILTIKQAEKIAKETNIPYGFLFLDSPPNIERPSIPDLRQSAAPDPLSVDFQETLEDIIYKQEWYIDYLIDEGMDIRLPFVGKYTTNDSPIVVSQAISEIIKYKASDRDKISDSSKLFNILVEKIEKIGILVFKNGCVKGNNRRGLSVKEFRGFALPNDIAPAIFINGKDAIHGQIFTLIHEVCHIFINESGVSDGSCEQYLHNSMHSTVEKFCNDVASEFLIPQKEFLVKWDNSCDAMTNINTLSKLFKVSMLAIAVKAIYLGKADRSVFKAVKNITDKAMRDMLDKKSTGGPSPIVMIPIRNSKTLTKTIVNKAASGTLLLRDASRLLNTNPSMIMKIREKAIHNG